MIKYDKLIRDRIPMYMKLQEKQFKVHEATEEEYKQKLKEKLLEEVSEFIENPCLEELADIQEVFNAILYNMEFSEQDLYMEMVKKTVTRGNFNKKLVLEWVKE